MTGLVLDRSGQNPGPVGSGSRARAEAARRNQVRVARTWRSHPPACWPLLTVLLVQSVLTLRLENSAFQDEALYLWAGRLQLQRLLHGTPVHNDFFRFFSGAPGLYPVIAAFVHQAFGLAGVRALSLLLMLGATVGLFACTRALFGPTPATFAALAFGLSAPVLFVGHLATYDALCFALLSLALWLAIRVARGRFAVVPAIACGAALVLAVLAKYAGLLFVPSVLAVLMVEAVPRLGWAKAAKRLGVTVLAAVTALDLVVLRFGYKGLVRGLTGTTTNRVAVIEASRSSLVEKFVALGGVVTLVAVLGTVVALRSGRRLLPILLLGTSLLPLAYHLETGESVSMQKHIAIGLFFAAPLAGVALSRLLSERSGHFRASRFAMAVAVGVAAVTIASTQSALLYSEWTNTDQMMMSLRTVVHPGSGRILVEEAEVARYRLHGLVADWQWTDLNSFQFASRSGALQGSEAYRTAIDDQYFDVVVLWYGANKTLAGEIRDEIARTGTYELVVRRQTKNRFGRGSYEIYRVVPAVTPTPGG